MCPHTLHPFVLSEDNTITSKHFQLCVLPLPEEQDSFLHENIVLVRNSGDEHEYLIKGTVSITPSALPDVCDGVDVSKYRSPVCLLLFFSLVL